MKSFSTVNMCRSVILAVIFAIFLSCVLAETDIHKPVNGSNCRNNVMVVSNRNIMRNCFNKLVELHLNPSAKLESGDCKNATEFGFKLESYLESLTKACNASWKPDTRIIVKLVDFSLKNNTFKTFYEDIACVREYETNISNTCVRDRLGHFEITKEKKNLAWTLKAYLQYDKTTCEKSEVLKNCVVAKLRPCKNTTTDYVKNLFDYARDLGNCSLYPPAGTLPPPIGNMAPVQADIWLSTPVIITLGIAGVVVVAAIITIIVLKCKN